MKEQIAKRLIMKENRIETIGKIRKEIMIKWFGSNLSRMGKQVISNQKRLLG